jgi:hypothetical protein
MRQGRGVFGGRFVEINKSCRPQRTTYGGVLTYAHEVWLEFKSALSLPLEVSLLIIMNP